MSDTKSPFTTPPLEISGTYSGKTRDALLLTREVCRGLHEAGLKRLSVSHQDERFHLVIKAKR